MVLRGLLIVFVASLTLATNALADEKPAGAEDFPKSATLQAPAAGYTYFFRPGATLAEQQSDFAACRPSVLALAHAEDLSVFNNGVVQGVANQQIAQYGMSGAVGSAIGMAIVAGMESAAARRRNVQSNYENCMVVRGWQVVEVDAVAGRQMDHLGQRALAERLQSLVGAPPQGTIVRSFDNAVDFTTPARIQVVSLSLQAMPPSLLSDGEDSVQAAIAEEDQHRGAAAQLARDRAAANALRLAAWRGGRLLEPIGSADRMVVPDGSALVIVAVSTALPRFVRVDVGGGGDAIGGRGASKDVASLSTADGTMLRAFVVSPGHWRLTTLSDETSFCMGAPSFEIAAGEVVYAGSWSVEGPDLTLGAVRAALSSSPTLAERIRAASFINGGTFECGGGALYAYAYEVPGAPFEHGYAWGSRAHLVLDAEPAAAPVSSSAGAVEATPSAQR